MPPCWPEPAGTSALPTGVTDWLLRELIRRERHGISFDLNDTTVLT
ncbi:hypothetical protein K1W54_02890 [Micromonospora sp. CPCC 205371]|nr:hypothetical protein [Micromonospora sp. CPCC 205371]